MFVEVTSVYNHTEIYLNLDHVECMIRREDETCIYIRGEGNEPSYRVLELPNEILARTRRY